MFLPDRPNRVDLARCADVDSQTRAPRPRTVAERLGGARAALLQSLEQAILPSRSLLRRGSVLLASSALVMAALFQPVAGVTPALAAATASAEASSTATQSAQPEWVQNTKATTLWADSKDSKSKLTAVPAGSKLRVISNLQDGRWRVHYEEKSGGNSAEGWVNQSETKAVQTSAPANEPAQKTNPGEQSDNPATADRGGPTPDISTPKKFVAAVAPAAQDSEREAGVPSSVTIAQAILESEWGRSGLSKKAQNYFGIKAASGPGPAGVVNMDTWEVFGGKDTVINDGFKAYHNLYESVMDHGRFLKQNARYADAFKASDPIEFARRMHKAGYATDPAYTTKIKSLIDSYNLAQYDLKK